MYEFSIGSFFFGFLILVVGVVFVRFYQWVANNFGNGVASYDHYRFYALITCCTGFIVMLNLHSLVLRWFFGHIFPGV
jgi:hypothetical protein